MSHLSITTAINSSSPSCDICSPLFSLQNISKKPEMAASVRPLTSNRFVSDESELVTVDVASAIKVMEGQVQRCYKADGKLRAEIGSHPAYKRAIQLWNNNENNIRTRILSVPQLKSTLDGFSKEDLADVHIAMIAYTLDKDKGRRRGEVEVGSGGIYKDFNAKTRELITASSTGNKYPYNIFLTHLWVGMRHIIGANERFPEKLYRGVRCSTENLSKVGKVFAFPQFASFTTDVEIALSFLQGSSRKTVFVLLLRKQRTLYATALYNHSPFNEKEIMFSPTHSYIVTGAKHMHGYNVIVCEINS